MRRILVIGFLFIGFLGFAQRWNSNGDNKTTGKLTLDGQFLNITMPNTQGAWARGFFNTDRENKTVIGGVGLLGNADKPTHYFIAHGQSPWQSDLGLYVKTNGRVGVGTKNPKAVLDVAKFIPNGSIGTVLGRLSEGNSSGTGTFLGVTGYQTQGSDVNNIKSFSLIHNFYGRTNSSINFYRGASTVGGFLTFNTHENIERMRILGNGRVGIGTKNPKAVLDVAKFIPNGSIGTVLGRLSEGNSSGTGTFLGVTGYQTQGSDVNNIKSFSLIHNFYGKTNSSINFYRGSSTIGGFLTFNTHENIERMRILGNGKVGIGTTKPDMMLTVNGNIHTKEVKVDLSIPAPDYVFAKEYNLRTIEEVESYIQENSHLPEIPSAAEFKENGLYLAAMDMNLLKKVEELTLYTIAQEKKIKQLELQNQKIDEQAKEIEALKTLVNQLIDSKK